MSYLHVSHYHRRLHPILAHGLCSYKLAQPRPSRNRPPKPRPQTFFPSAVYQMRTFSRPMDPSKLLFRVPIKTNKVVVALIRPLVAHRMPLQIMIKHYLSSIYGLDITKVNTVNYDGERKRVHGKRGEWYQVRALVAPPELVPFLTSAAETWLQEGYCNPCQEVKG